MSLRALQHKLQSLWQSSKYFRVISIAITCSFGCIMMRRVFLRSYRKFYHIPPGPAGIPLFGSLLSFGVSPQQFLVNNYKYGAISSFYLGSSLIISVNRGDIGHQILKKAARSTTNKLNNRPYSNLHSNLPNRYIPSENGEKWSKRRKFGFAKFVTISNSNLIINAMKHAINNYVATEINVCIAENKLFYPHKYTFYMGFNAVYSAIFGKTIDIEESTVDIWCHHIEQMLASFMPVFMLQLFNINFIPPKLFWIFASFKTNMKIIEDDIEEYMIKEGEFELNCDNLWKRNKEQNNSAFIDAAISYQYKEEWYDKQMLLNDIATYFMAGADTTGNSAEFGILLLAKFPNIQQEIYDELIYILDKNNEKEFTFSVINQLHKFRSFIHELLRISTVAPLGLFHLIENDIQCKIDNENEYCLPRKSLLILNHIVIHKYSWNNTKHCDDKINLKYWLDENGKFKMNSKFIIFGSGSRDCMGRSIAMKNLYALFAILMTKYKFVNPNIDKTMDIQQKWGPVMTLHPIGLKVVKR